MRVNFAVFEVLRIDENHAVDRIDVTTVIQEIPFAQVTEKRRRRRRKGRRKRAWKDENVYGMVRIGSCKMRP